MDDQHNIEIPPEDAEILDTLQTIGKQRGHARKALIDRISAEAWQILVARFHGVIMRMGVATGITTEAIVSRLDALGIEHDPTDRRSMEQRQASTRMQALFDKLEIRSDPHPVPRLDGTRVWGVASDPHIPTTDPVELKRFHAVCKAEKVDGVLFAGDLGNWDAVSHFAGKDRGKMPRLQEEVEVMREALSIFEDEFGEVHVMITNHEQRLLATLHGELDGPDLFACLLKHAIFHDSRLCDIGGVRIIHPQRARKWWVTQANDYVARYEMPVYIAHNHRFGTGHSASGRPIGSLGGLFWKDRIGYYNDDPGYLEWQNGFFIYRAGGMAPYSDCVDTDWGRYGVE